MKKKTLKEKFDEKYIPDPNTGCWLWSASLYKDGYGQIVDKESRRSPKRAHRVSYELYNGPISDDVLVLHRCDTPACVNPDHLFLGTHNDNMKDKVKKGRNVAQNSLKSLCKRGHLFLPVNKYGRRICRECPKARLKAARENNKKHINTLARERYAKNSEHFRNKNKKYRAKHPDLVKKYKKKYNARPENKFRHAMAERKRRLKRKLQKCELQLEF